MPVFLVCYWLDRCGTCRYKQTFCFNSLGVVTIDQSFAFVVLNTMLHFPHYILSKLCNRTSNVIFSLCCQGLFAVYGTDSPYCSCSYSVRSTGLFYHHETLKTGEIFGFRQRPHAASSLCDTPMSQLNAHNLASLNHEVELFCALLSSMDYIKIKLYKICNKLQSATNKLIMVYLL